MSGEMDKIKGKAKQAAGDLSGNDDLRREGKLDEAAGKVKDAVSKVADTLKDALSKGSAKRS